MRYPSKFADEDDISYIKELADRVSHLEKRGYTVTDDGNGEPVSFGSGNFPSSALKRTHSEAEGLNDHYTDNDRGGFPPQDPEGIDLDLDQGLYMLQSSVFAIHSRQIHSVLPFLSDSLEDVRSEAAEASNSAGNALLSALQGALNSVHWSGTVQPISGAHMLYSAKADSLLHTSLGSESPSLIHVHTLILLLVGANHTGSISFNTGLSPAVYLGQAVTIAKKLALFDLFRPGAVPNYDSYLAIARGTVLSLHILDGFMSVADRKVGSALAGTHFEVHQSDQEIGGTRAYWLAGKSFPLDLVPRISLTHCQQSP
jgi:hypothetical protein